MIRLRPRRAVQAVVVACAALSLALAAGVPPEVLPNADAGVKFLLTRQFATGDLRVSLHLPAEPWVASLWQDGLYPIRYPMVIERQGQRFGLFPATLPLLTAPFYRWLGFPGLLVLPLLGFWVLLAALVRAGRGLRLSTRAIVLTLLALGIGSPVLVYSAIFWEHTPSLALATLGLALTVSAPAQAGQRRQAFVGGLLLGLSTLLREELVVLATLAVPATWLAFPRERGRGGRVAGVAGGLVLGALLVMLWNYAWYAHLLGLHALTALQSAIWRQPGRVLQVFQAILGSFVEHVPLAWVAPPLILVATRSSRLEQTRRPLVLLLLALLVILLVPPLVRSDGGKQWGPRYAFAALAPLLLGLMGLMKALPQRMRLARLGFALLIVASLARGIWVNSVVGIRWLAGTYQRRAEAVATVRALPVIAIAVSQSSVALDLAALVEDRRLFQATRGSHVRLLAKVLQFRGVTRLAYVCHDSVSECGPFEGLPARVELLRADSGEPLADFRIWAELDRYTIYLGELARASPSPF